MSRLLQRRKVYLSRHISVNSTELVVYIALSFTAGRCHNKHIRAYFAANVAAVQNRFVWRYVFFKYVF
jgi:hypothetical protein